MLVLGRKCGESVIVPHCNMIITVLAVDGSKVRLGFSAPDQIQIYREEVWCRIVPETPGDAVDSSPLETKERRAQRPPRTVIQRERAVSPAK
jgi:carbon storage regulator